MFTIFKGGFILCIRLERFVSVIKLYLKLISAIEHENLTIFFNDLDCLKFKKRLNYF